MGNFLWGSAHPKKEISKPTPTRTTGTGGKDIPHNKPVISDKDKAILDLKIVRDKLGKYQRKLEGENLKTNKQILQLMHENKKPRALLLLRLRNYKEKEMEKIDDQMLTVLKMIEDIEWETINIEALHAIQLGTDALKNIHTIMTPDHVRALLEDSQEAINMENEINELLRGSGIELDEVELEEEYNLLAEEEGDVKASKSQAKLTTTDELPTVPTDIPLPTVPTDEPILKRKNEKHVTVTEPVMIAN